MAVRHFLSVADFGSEHIAHLVNRSIEIAHNDGPAGHPLRDKLVGIYFRGPSTRTRTSFTVAAIRLGASTVAYGPNDLQIATGETICDTARVLSGFLDALVIRTNQADSEMRAFAGQNQMAVINAMSESEHPTQAIADLTTIREEFGRLSGVHVLYLGEGNNTAASLAFAVSVTSGMRLTLVTPEGNGLSDQCLDAAIRLADKSGAAIEQHHDADSLPKDADVVYTTRWQTMGVPKADRDWRERFRPFAVTPGLMARVSKGTNAIFLHDLPAVRGEEVYDEVLDGPQSRAFQQARHKLNSAMAVLEWCLSGA
ncbi:MAG: ornithine carbamoyltransferase [Blastocatellia bacterium]